MHQVHKLNSPTFCSDPLLLIFLLVRRTSRQAPKETAMKPFTTIAVALFTLVALLHLLRILMGWRVLIQGAVVPMWVSYLGLVVAGGLAFLLWRESRPGKP